MRYVIKLRGSKKYLRFKGFYSYELVLDIEEAFQFRTLSFARKLRSMLEFNWFNKFWMFKIEKLKEEQNDRI